MIKSLKKYSFHLAFDFSHHLLRQTLRVWSSRVDSCQIQSGDKQSKMHSGDESWLPADHKSHLFTVITAIFNNECGRDEMVFQYHSN